jgi:Holliday junction resolvase-like predicted endonuclease
MNRLLVILTTFFLFLPQAQANVVLSVGVDNGSLTNLPKSFWDDAYKYKPVSGTQKTLLDDIVKNGDNAIDGAASGSKTEALVEDIFKSQDYKLINGKYAGESGNNGFDIVAYKGTLDNPTEIVIVECKQMNNGAVKLNAASKTTPLPAQMSDTWIRYDAGKLKSNPPTSALGNKIDNLMDTLPTFIQKYVVAVDRNTGEINLLKLGNY